MESTRRSTYLGIALMATTWSIYAIISTLAKHTYQYTPPIVAFFFQNFVALLIITPFLMKQGLGAFKPKLPHVLFWRCVGGTASFYCFFHCLGRLPLTNCTVLSCTAPLFTPLILLALWKRKSPWQVWLSLLLGFSGILIIFPPQTQSFNGHTLIGLLGGLGTAMVMFLIRALANEFYLRVMFYYLLTASLASFPFALSYFGSVPASIWPIFASIGALFSLAQVSYTLSLRKACPSLSAPFSYIFILMAVLIDALLYQRIPTIQNCIGISLVVIGGGVILQKLAKKDTEEEMCTERDSNP